MRPGVTLNHLGGTFEAQQHPPYQYQQHQHHITPSNTAGWKSPVPYLFGGLAAMLGLIAFALLILACSYWKLSGYLDAGEDSGEYSGEGKPKDVASTIMYPKSILVIMAGEEKPTFLATPVMTSRGSSFRDSDSSNASCSSSSGGSADVGGENDHKVVELETKTETETETETETGTSRALDEEKR